MADLRERFGRLLAAHRRREGLTQEALAEAAGLSVDMMPGSMLPAASPASPAPSRQRDELPAAPALSITNALCGPPDFCAYNLHRKTTSTRRPRIHDGESVSYIRNAEAAFRNNSITEFLHRWFEDGRVADRSKKGKHQGNGRTTIEHPESLQEIACVKQFDLVQGYSY